MAGENASGPVWVVAEQQDGQVLAVSNQLVGQARVLAYVLGAEVEGVLLGEGTGEAARDLIAAGADRVWAADHAELAVYQQDLYAAILTRLARERSPQIVLWGATDTSRELAPLLAARLETGLTAHCTGLNLDDTGVLEQWIPAYGGLIAITCPQRRPQMATVARGVFPEPVLDESRTGEIVPLALPGNVSPRVRTLEIVHDAPSTVPLASASIVVAGGAGLGDSEGWSQVQELARVLNAGLGCTRPVVDDGWAGLEMMVGQSGQMTSPELYIGVGLSGEQQHMVGVGGAKVMVAINNDDAAPIFGQVDYGVVEDCREFLPVLIERIAAYRG